MGIEHHMPRWGITSLLAEEGAVKSGLVNILSQRICVPDDNGVYRPYEEIAELVVGVGAHSNPNYGTHVNFDSFPTECPRFRRCDGCPKRLGSIATQSCD